MVKVRTKPKFATPGEKLAVIEEFGVGKGAYLSEGIIRASVIGEAFYDFKRRLTGVKPVRFVSGVPKPGDEVIGQVEAFQTNIIAVKIYYINGIRSQAGFTGLIIGPLRKVKGKTGTLCKPGDLVKAKVVSDVNAIIHLSIDGPDLGVVHTSCSVCGGSVKKVGGKLKCIECGNVEERKLSFDFGKVALG